MERASGYLLSAVMLLVTLSFSAVMLKVPINQITCFISVVQR